MEDAIANLIEVTEHHITDLRESRDLLHELGVMSNVANQFDQAAFALEKAVLKVKECKTVTR